MPRPKDPISHIAALSSLGSAVLEAVRESALLRRPRRARRTVRRKKSAPKAATKRVPRAKRGQALAEVGD